ncbi:MAG: ABC transporter transmembrane domain-containing protein [Geminicoccaceae bacterium]
MEGSIYGFVRRYSAREQLVILAMSIASLPIVYFSLELPKTIINEALSGEGPFHFFGRELDQVSYLMTLSGIFLGLVLGGGLLKYVTNVYVGIVAERMLRRLRYLLYSQVMRFPLNHLKRVSQGELVQLINAETEPLGGFVGDAISVPAVQGGYLLTSLLFMFMQDWALGLAAIALYPVQIYLIPKLQAQVNALGKLRVRQVRKNAERISEMASSVRDIRANDATWWERARFSNDLFAVYDLRFQIYKKKYMIKFINNFIAQLGPFFFYSIGGYLVIQGNLTIGALVAVVGAQKDMASPWRELLTYYQTLYDVKIKYEQVVAQFMPPGLREPRLQDEEPTDPPRLQGELQVSSVVVKDEDGDPLLDGVSFTIPLPSTLALTGPAGGGREELTLVLAGLLLPDSGRILIGGTDVAALPEAVLGRRIAYVAQPTAIFAGSIRDNLLYGLRHRPTGQMDAALEASRARYRLEAVRSGNAVFDPLADWTALADAGLGGPNELGPRLVSVLTAVRLDVDVYAMGLRSPVGDQIGLGDSILEARRAMHARLEADPRLARLIERFDPASYNNNATLAENLLFGAPIGPAFDPEQLAADLSKERPGSVRLAARGYFREVLKRTGLLDELRDVGWKLAVTMTELFADLPPDHEYFQQFNFVIAEELPYYRQLVARGDPSRLGDLPESDRDKLLALPFKLIQARHRLGLITPDVQAKVLSARAYFREHLPAELADTIAFFDPDRFNEASSIQDNILFGKIAYGQAQANQRISEVMGEVVAELDLRDRIIEVGVGAECGIGGNRLSPPQRQKLAIARALLKRPDVLILFDALLAIDSSEQPFVRDSILAEMEGRTIIATVPNEEAAKRFDYVLLLEGGSAALRRNDQKLGGRHGERQLVTASE